MFKVNFKNTRTMSLTSFTPFSGVSIVSFEIVIILTQPISNQCSPLLPPENTRKALA